MRYSFSISISISSMNISVRIKRHFPFPLVIRELKEILWNTPYFGNASYLYQRMPIGLNISLSIWQSYINRILDCLQSKKYCEAIMDDLLLFTPSKQCHMDKLEDLLKALLKNGLKISQRNANCLELIYNIWVMKYLFKTKECACNL